jgi:ABC-type uncharacterized transport system auxiliary subunit
MNVRSSVLSTPARRIFAGLMFCAPALTLQGCSMSQPFPDRATFAPDPGKPEKSPSPGALTIVVRPVRIAQPYDAQLFNYKVGPSQFTQDYYGGFIAPPDRLMGAQLLDWINDSGAVQYARMQGSGLDTVASLESHISAMYADHTANQAVLEMRVFLISDPAGIVPGQILFQKHYSEKEPLPDRTAAGFVAALNKAWRRTLTAISEDLRRIQPPAPASVPAPQ